MSIPGSAISLLGAGSAGYEIERSLRFNSADSAYLSRTPASAGNRTVFTFSTWIKRCKFSTDQIIYVAYTDDNNYSTIEFRTDNTLRVANISGGVLRCERRTSQVFRDPSAFFSLVVSSNSSTSLKIYVNGTEVTTFSASTGPDATNWFFNSTIAHNIGRYAGGWYGDYYLADIHFIDGQALDPTSFGRFDTNGVWQPIDYTGTYGTNGFHLDFADNSAATATTLGKDTSGNGNNWTPNNLTAVEANYTARTSLTGTIYSGAGGVSKIFDGTTATCGPDNGSYATFTPSAPIPINTSLRVRANVSSTSVDANFQINGSPRSTVSLGFPASGSIFDAASTWVTITSPPSSLTSLTFGWTGSWMTVSGIEIDGTVLVDSASDSLVDTPTSYGTDTGAGGEVRGNYCTLNPLGTAGAIPTNGNLSVSSSSTAGNRISTFFLTTGKWYWEGSGTGYVGAIIGRDGATYTGSISGTGSNAIGWWYAGPVYWDGGNNSGSTTYTSSDIIGIALDMDSGDVKFYKNGSLVYTITFGSGTVPDLSSGVFPGYNVGASTQSVDFNFGQRPFAYTAPSGYKALCTANLPDPVVAQPSTVMDVKLWNGNSSTQNITGLAFSPDLAWVKGRVGSLNHVLSDTIRGANLKLASNTTGAEAGTDNGTISAFNSDGISVAMGTGTYAGYETNLSGYSYVGWFWDAGSSTVTNTAGTISSQVRANASAGFSVVTFTGNQTSGATVGHGLGVAPQMMFVKSRSATGSWFVYHVSITNTQYLTLQTTDAVQSSAAAWNNTSPTSTVFTLGNNIQPSGVTQVAYCFAPVAGYSAFGSYTGNGSADGPFVYTGFRPRWIMVKRSDSISHWTIWDTARNTFNYSGTILFANLSNAEESANPVGGQQVIDILSNGFKLRDTGGSGQVNANGGTYIYAAFAESPFALARAR